MNYIRIITKVFIKKLLINRQQSHKYFSDPTLELRVLWVSGNIFVVYRTRTSRVPAGYSSAAPRRSSIRIVGIEIPLSKNI